MFRIVDRIIIIINGLVLPLLLLASTSSMANSIHFTKLQSAAFTSSFSTRSVTAAATKTRFPTSVSFRTRNFWGITRQQSLVQTGRTMSSSSSSPSSSASRIIPRAAVSVVVQCCCKSNDNTNKKDNDNDNNHDFYYLLIHRGKEPNKGKWSLPGGKIEPGETTLQGAMRELGEETKWPPPTQQLSSSSSSTAKTTTTTRRDDSTTVILIKSNSSVAGSSRHLESWERSSLLRWYPMPITVSDSIGEGYHYVIAQCFAELSFPLPLPSTTATTSATATMEEERINSSCCWPPPLLAADDAAQADWFTCREIQCMEQEGQVTPGVSRVVVRAKELSLHGLLPTVPAQQLP